MEMCDGVKFRQILKQRPEIGEIAVFSDTDSMEDNGIFDQKASHICFPFL
jgi:hypothetical protein